MIDESLINALQNKLEELELLKRFKYLKNEIEKTRVFKANEKLFKELQKKIVRKEAGEKEKYNYQELKVFFDENPLLQEFKELQKEINNLISCINTVINQEINAE